MGVFQSWPEDEIIPKQHRNLEFQRCRAEAHKLPERLNGFLLSEVSYNLGSPHGVFEVHDKRGEATREPVLVRLRFGARDWKVVPRTYDGPLLLDHNYSLLKAVLRDEIGDEPPCPLHCLFVDVLSLSRLGKAEAPAHSQVAQPLQPERQLLDSREEVVCSDGPRAEEGDEVESCAMVLASQTGPTQVSDGGVEAAESGDHPTRMVADAPVAKPPAKRPRFVSPSALVLPRSTMQRAASRSKVSCGLEEVAVTADEQAAMEIDDALRALSSASHEADTLFKPRKLSTPQGGLLLIVVYSIAHSWWCDGWAIEWGSSAIVDWIVDIGPEHS